MNAKHRESFENSKGNPAGEALEQGIAPPSILVPLHADRSRGRLSLMKNACSLWTLCLLGGIGVISAPANDLRWPQWRGPEANGVAAPGNYPIAFSDSRQVAWKTPLPGAGSSTPAIWGDHLFITAGVPEDSQSQDEEAPRFDAVIAYDLEGKER